MKNVLTPLAKSGLVPLGWKAVASAANAGIHKKFLRSGATTLIISNEKMRDIMKIVKSLEDTVLLIKDITQRIENVTKEHSVGYLSMMSGTLGASLLRNMTVC